MDDSIRPTGRIDQVLRSHGMLARLYHQYLHAKLPIDNWEDIGEMATPLPQKIEYPIDWKLVGRLAAICPPLPGVVESSVSYNGLALKLGWHYAWSRFAQHAHLLDIIEHLYLPEKPGPKLIIEPGCFTGGLLHFLADHWPKTKCLGMDVSPVALDVCSKFSDELKQRNRPVWLEADFCQIRPEELPNNLGENVRGGLVIISNAIESLWHSFARFPYLDKWNIRSRLISYWVNQGCTVLLAERHPNPDHLLDTIIEQGAWESDGCKGHLLRTFSVMITEGMGEASALGTWKEVNGFVMAFVPAPAKKKGKPKIK